ncbi:MAG: nucleotide sugar dehydrogenase, partial [Anaerolineae bacterium]|nr:nucleotide sugar dehydrogenase [Anaerolineae bacterium]
MPINGTYDICIIGGCGHVGLPLGLAFADHGKRVVLYDRNEKAVEAIRAKRLPFLEEGGSEVLNRTVDAAHLHTTTDINVIQNTPIIIIVIGTPVDEHLNPRLHDVMEIIRQIINYLSDEQLLILRSTIFPGVTFKIHDFIQSSGKKTGVAFCPERIAEGHGLQEITTLPQIVSGCDDQSVERAKRLFLVLTSDVVELSPLEAELAKLFSNAWRYINFAISNQFYMIAGSYGLDFYKIYHAMKKNYPRLQGIARAGFTAGPCLFKDTMQLSAASSNNFFLGHAAMLVNEGMPNFIIEKLKAKVGLKDSTVGILGMAFKADSDDSRESLAFKLKKLLELEASRVLCTDPYVYQPGFVGVDT